MDGAADRLTCPYCEAYGVSRLFLATARLDSCECVECGARWDEDPFTGKVRGRGGRQSAIDSSTRTSTVR